MISTTLKTLLRTATLCAAVLFPVFGHAGTFTLIDGNSEADFDTAATNNQVNWSIDGIDQLFEQAFYYRVGNGPEISVHTLPIALEGTTDVNLSGDDNALFVRYDGTDFDIEITYVLDGGLPGSGASDLAEQISISSKTESDLDFHFFQYVDFDLNGTSGGDTGVFTNDNTVAQSEGAVSVSETVVTPVANHREMGSFPSIRNKLQDGIATTLNDTPATGINFSGDVTWAFQWDFTLVPSGPGSTFQISKDKNLQIIPEPTTAMLLLGGLVVGVAHRKRS